MRLTDRSRIPALIWAALLFAAALVIALRLPAEHVTSDILAMLPKAGGMSEVQDAFLARLNRQVLYAVKDEGAVREGFAQKLAESPYIERVRGRITDEEKRQAWAALQKTLGAVLTDAQIAKLADPARYAREVIGLLYSPLAGVSQSEVKNDPLLLTRRMLLAQKSAVSESKGYLTAKDREGQTWSLFFAELKEGLSAQDKAAFLAFESKLRSDTEKQLGQGALLAQSTLFYNRCAEDTAKGDMTRLGTLSAVLLAALFLLSFRSLKPLGLGLLSVASGLLLGGAAALLCFKTLHAVTLVMCVSLIGIATDYTTYFVCAHRTAPKGTPASETLLRLRPSLIHAMVTTVIAYGLLAAAPFPGLEELAVFAVFGLLGACLTVLLWFPLFLGPSKGEGLPKVKLFPAYLAAWKKRGAVSFAVLAVCAAVSAAGLMKLSATDDLNALQTPPAHLKAQENAIKALLGNDLTQEWIIAEGKNEAELLGKVEALRSEFGGKLLLPALRSPEVQERAGAALAAAHEAVKARLAKIGIAAGGAYSPSATLSDYLASPAGEAFSALFLSKDGTLYLAAPVVRFDPAMKKTAAGVYVHRKAEIEEMLRELRSHLSVFLAAAFLLVLASYFFKYGAKKTLGTALILGLAFTTSLGALALAGLPMNIFSLFALILVLGIGIDYAVFFSYLEKDHADSVLFALGLAAASTLISLGILLFCHTDAVRNFGLVLSVGVLTAFLTSPLLTWFGEKR
jgi:predicted exporter